MMHSPYVPLPFSTLLVSWFPHALKKDPNGIKAILEISSLVVCPNYYFWRGYKYIFSQFIVIISIFVDCNKSKFLKKKKKQKRVRLHMRCCQRSSLQCGLICSFIPQALTECLLCLRHSRSWALTLRSSPSRRREKLVGTIAWCPCPDKIHITQYAHPEEG